MKKLSFTYIRDGFCGTLFDPENGDNRVLLVLQGLKGLSLPERYAAMFAEKGYASLAMTYYGEEGQPQNMRAIPLEQFAAAAAMLRMLGFSRIGIYGNSKGAGMALLAASFVPEISLCIAASPFAHIMEGDGKPEDSPIRSMVSWQGQELPYIPRENTVQEWVQYSAQQHRLRLRYFFEAWERHGTELEEIPVEHIHGAILFLTATHDDSIPAREDAALLCQRLKQRHFAYPVRHINSETGSHNLGYFPVNNHLLPWEWFHRSDCQKARKQALSHILQAIAVWNVR